MKKEIDSFGTSCYCYMLGIRRIDKVRIEKVLKRMRRNNLNNLPYKRQLRLYVLVMSRTRFRVNPHAIVACMSRNSLFEAGGKYKSEVTATGLEPLSS